MMQFDKRLMLAAAMLVAVGTLAACDTGPKSPAEQAIASADAKADAMEQRAEAMRAEARSLDQQADALRAEGKAEANALTAQAVEDAGPIEMEPVPAAVPEPAPKTARITDPPREAIDEPQAQ